MGTLCLGGSIGQHSPFDVVDGAGTATVDINPRSLPISTGSVVARSGLVHYFQFWHRDQVGGQSTSNWTNAVRLHFD